MGFLSGFSIDSGQCLPGRLPKRSNLISILEHSFVALGELYLLSKYDSGSMLLRGISLDHALVTSRVFHRSATVSNRAGTPAQHILDHV